MVLPVGDVWGMLWPFHGGIHSIVFIFLASGVPDPFPFVREIKERYALASFLGRGSFGDVILAFDKISCQKLAIKRIKTTPGEGNLELNVLKTIDHPCVLRLLDHVLTPDDTFLILQLCEGGPLSGVVFPKRTLNELEVKTVFYQLTLALQYLHDIGIVHRDVKLDNILLFSKEPETLIKLIDFGASNCSGSLALGTPIGSSLYVAPEVLRASLVGSTYCHQADVWSAGVVLFLCLGGYQPFLDHESILNGDFNLEPSIWDKVSPPARDLVQRMLEVDPRLRVSIKHILRHKWMKDSRLKSKVYSLMKAEIKHWRECSISSSLRERVLVLELSKAMRKELGEDSNRYQSHLPASYVKFVEGSGGRVVPIMIGRKKKYYKNLMKSLNGVLFPGGAVNFEDADGYAAAGANLLDLATEANQNGDYFPVWGTCLGFQLLTYLAAGRREHRANCYSTQQTLPLEFRTDFRDSKMFQNAPDHVIEILKTKDVNANFHSYCVTEKNMTKMGLIPDWRILATNHDLNGLEFVSVIESRDFPYYGVIAHPEKNPYEFNPTRNYPHRAGAVMVAQFFANFFVDEARKSSHQFSEPTEERESLIYNFEPVHTGARSIFEQTYFFREKLP